ncbi:MAG: hypothetical protein ACR2F6_03345 [Mycobacteriales bacterium]
MSWSDADQSDLLRAAQTGPGHSSARRIEALQSAAVSAKRAAAHDQDTFTWPVPKTLTATIQAAPTPARGTPIDEAILAVIEIQGWRHAGYLINSRGSAAVRRARVLYLFGRSPRARSLPRHSVPGR